MDELFNDINEELDLMSYWMRQNKLSLNAKKGEFMLIGHPRQLKATRDFTNLELNDEKLGSVHETNIWAFL